MKVKEFISILSEHNPDAEIIISRDSEGNGFSPIDDVDRVLYSPIGQGDIYSLEEKEVVGENAINAVVLYSLDNYSLRNWQLAQQERIHS